MAANPVIPDEEQPQVKLPQPPNKRVKTPTVLQMEAVECGAAALSIILSYYNRIVPLEELRIECGVSRDGSKASNVLKAARKYGLIAKGFKYDKLDNLYKLDLPVILFWNMNHFLVLEGYKKGRVFLSDPATGPREITLEELDASFSGIVLTFKPGDDFEEGGEKPSMMAALRRRLKGSEHAMLFALLCGLFLVVPGLVVPTFSRFFIDEVLVGGRNQFLLPLIFGMAMTAAIRMVLTWLQEYYLLRLETKVALVTSSDFFNHILRLPVNYFAQRYSGEIGSRVAINNKVANIVSGKLTTTVLDCIMIGFYAMLMFIYDVTLTLTCIVIATLNIAAVKYVARMRTDAARQLLQESGKLTGTAMNGLRMIETLKATGGEGEFFSRWAGYQAKALKAEQEMGQLSEYVNAVPPLVTSLTTSAILLLGGLKVMNGDLTIGMLVAYQSLMGSFTKPLNTFTSFGGTLQELEADMNRIDDVLKYPIDDQYSADKEQRRKDVAGDIVKLSGHVELRNVNFGYNPLEDPLIQDFSLVIEPGQRVALVGMSGSGKSTISKIITGLYKHWNGDVLFDGIPREDLPVSVINNSLAAVDQEIFLFGGTIAENVTMWDSTIPIARVTEACRDAQIDDLVQNRVGTYNSVVEEGGGNFSGGQRQRLEISRALVSNPSILCLDEATSALDPTTERLIDEAMRRRGCTCIIVAHRLSTIRDADEIVVMERGKIVQRGTHDQLKEVRGLYQFLIKE
jgi:NHLM bacteriocin system ABC transporter peptidase/ATP-binding protein